MPLLLAYLGFVGVGLPEGVLGVGWPHMRDDFGVPLGAVGFLLVTGTTGYVLASVTAGFTLDRLGVGWLLAGSTGLAAAALAGIGLAPLLLVAAVASFGLGVAHGAIDTGLNAYVARHYGARHLSWLHASFGLGATVGPLVMTGVLAAGLWAYTLLTEGRGMAQHLAGLAVLAYWGSMFAGRILAGAVTDRIGVHRVLIFGVTGMAAGAALVALPAPGWLATAGFLLIGFAAAPMFPLLTLTTAERVGPEHADRTIGVQVGASALGGALVPTGIGVLMGRLGPEILGPSLLLLAALLAVIYAASRRTHLRRPTTRGSGARGGR